MLSRGATLAFEEWSSNTNLEVSHAGPMGNMKVNVGFSTNRSGRRRSKVKEKMRGAARRIKKKTKNAWA